MLTTAIYNTPQYFGYAGNLPGGYGQYQPRHLFTNPEYCQDPENEMWYSHAVKLIELGNLKGLRVLELGCAFGALVRALQSLGVDAYGLDLPYPIGVAIGRVALPEKYPTECVWPELAPFLMAADAREYLATTDDHWDVILSRHFLECFSDQDLITLIPAMNRLTNRQLHILSDDADPDFYNFKSLEEWQVLPFENTVILHG